MVAVCKEWKLPINFFKPRCTNEMHPVEGVKSCPACIMPMQQFGGCPGIDGCSTVVFPRYILLNLRSSLSEDAHTYPRYVTDAYFTHGFYDLYPTAAEIGTPCILSPESWSYIDGLGSNAGCSWSYTKTTYRHYKRTTTYRYDTDPLKRYYLDDELEITDDESLSSPYSCSDSTVGNDIIKEYCVTRPSSFTWTFRLTQSSGTPSAQLRLTRLVARHVEYDHPGGAPSWQPPWTLKWIPIDDGGFAMSPGAVAPQVHATAPNSFSGAYIDVPYGFAWPSANPGLGAYSTLGVWSITSSALCSMQRPWVLPKTYDRSTPEASPFDNPIAINGLPSFVEIFAGVP